MYKPSEIYISTSNVDMRKGLDGFVSIIEQQFKLDPMSSAMFVFHNLHCDKIKILFWDSEASVCSTSVSSVENSGFREATAVIHILC